MGYETDIVTLLPQTTVTASGNATATFFGSDWVRGYLYIKAATVSGTSPTFLPFFQVSPDNGTTWIGAGGANSGGLVTNTLQAQNGTTIAAIAITAATNYILPVNGFPGTLFRLGYTVGGTTPSMQLTVFGDFQKWVADST